MAAAYDFPHDALPSRPTCFCVYSFDAGLVGIDGSRPQLE